jgi:hypothetical protein
MRVWLLPDARHTLMMEARMQPDSSSSPARNRFALLCLAALATMATPVLADDAMAPLLGAIGETKPIADARLRFESVEQEPFAKEASSATLRARLGFETGKAWGTALLVEGEAVVPLNTNYNSTTNGHVTYPVVADPESYELNRLQLSNTSITDTTVTLGRQRITLDDHRFIGNVGWRQNEQTFDALRVVNKHITNVTIDVSYVNQVNRIFGPDGTGVNTGRYTGDNFLANVSWQSTLGKLTGFGYLLKFEQLPTGLRDSSQTFGLRFAGERPLAKVKLAYIASWATQEDRGANPLSFNNDYYLGELNATFRNYNLGAGYEVLQGNGTKGFTTPLATLHRFQGWADKFLTTPVNGISDQYLNAGFQKKGVGPLETLSLTGSWHKYDSERLAIDYGSELNVQLQARFQRYTGTVKYAAYNAASTTPLTVRDTDKLWAQVDYAW